MYYDIHIFVDGSELTKKFLILSFWVFALTNP